MDDLWVEDEGYDLHSAPFQPEQVISGSFDEDTKDEYSEEQEEEFIMPNI
jgi:hypothetical protein